MASEQRRRLAGLAALAGGLLGVAIAPLMVMVKYATGWSILPRPAWEPVARRAVEPLVTFASPVALWVFYGAIYTAALLLMLTGALALRAGLAGRMGRAGGIAFWVMLAGFGLVIPGDALHTATWHLGGLTVPRPGNHPIATLGMSMTMLGMPLVIAGAFAFGIVALRRRLLPAWQGAAFVAAAVGAVLMPMTLMPAVPSGALWIFSALMAALGARLATGRAPEPARVRVSP